MHRSKQHLYSITSSARASNVMSAFFPKADISRRRSNVR
jgi:hypothetical protein